MRTINQIGEVVLTEGSVGCIRCERGESLVHHNRALEGRGFMLHIISLSV